MEGVIQKWGNSNAIRLPKSILQSVNIKENDSVMLTASGEEIIIRKLDKGFSHSTLEQRLTNAGFPLNYKIVATDLDDSSIRDEVFW